MNSMLITILLSIILLNNDILIINQELALFIIITSTIILLYKNINNIIEKNLGDIRRNHIEKMGFYFLTMVSADDHVNNHTGLQTAATIITVGSIIYIGYHVIPSVYNGLKPHMKMTNQMKEAQEAARDLKENLRLPTEKSSFLNPKVHDIPEVLRTNTQKSSFFWPKMPDAQEALRISAQKNLPANEVSPMIKKISEQNLDKFLSPDLIKIVMKKIYLTDVFPPILAQMAETPLTTNIQAASILTQVFVVLCDCDRLPELNVVFKNAKTILDAVSDKIYDGKNTVPIEKREIIREYVMEQNRKLVKALYDHGGPKFFHSFFRK